MERSSGVLQGGRDEGILDFDRADQATRLLDFHCSMELKMFFKQIIFEGEELTGSGRVLIKICLLHLID